MSRRDLFGLVVTGLQNLRLQLDSETADSKPERISLSANSLKDIIRIYETLGSFEPSTTTESFEISQNTQQANHTTKQHSDASHQTSSELYRSDAALTEDTIKSLLEPWELKSCITTEQQARPRTRPAIHKTVIDNLSCEANGISTHEHLYIPCRISKKRLKPSSKQPQTELEKISAEPVLINMNDAMKDLFPAIDKVLEKYHHRNSVVGNATVVTNSTIIAPAAETVDASRVNISLLESSAIELAAPAPPKSTRSTRVNQPTQPKLIKWKCAPTRPISTETHQIFQPNSVAQPCRSLSPRTLNSGIEAFVDKKARWNRRVALKRTIATLEYAEEGSLQSLHHELVRHWVKIRGSVIRREEGTMEFAAQYRVWRKVALILIRWQLMMGEDIPKGI